MRTLLRLARQSTTRGVYRPYVTSHPFFTYVRGRKKDWESDWSVQTRHLRWQRRGHNPIHNFFLYEYSIDHFDCLHCFLSIQFGVTRVSTVDNTLDNVYKIKTNILMGQKVTKWLHRWHDNRKSQSHAHSGTTKAQYFTGRYSVTRKAKHKKARHGLSMAKIINRRK